MNISFLLLLLSYLGQMNCLKAIKTNCCLFRRRNASSDVITYTEIANKQFDEYLTNIEYKDTTAFIPPIVAGKVIKVYDGDTITVASKIPGTAVPIYRFRVRLAGIDSAEIKGHTEEEKRAAIEARDALHKLIFGKMIVLRNVGTEKYGRILADIYIENLHINQWMLDNNYAVPYDGGKKVRPPEWDNEL
jgi:endonuclease YncB( thermonuclease family)